jgi:hypothetical protein
VPSPRAQPYRQERLKGRGSTALISYALGSPFTKISYSAVLDRKPTGTKGMEEQRRVA